MLGDLVRYERWGALVAIWLPLVALALVGCGSDSASTTAGQPQRPARPLAEGADLAGVHSGEVEVSLDIARPEKEERVHMQSRALFIGVGRENPPQFDMSAQSHGELGGRSTGFLGAFLLQPNRAVLFYRGHTYRPRGSTFHILKSKFERAQGKGGQGDPMACVEALKGEKITQLLRGFRNEGRRKDHDGTPVTLIGSELDVGRAFAALGLAADDPACRAQLEALRLPTGAQLESIKAEAVQAVDDSHVQLAVDGHGVLRDISVEVTARTPAGERLEIEFKWLLENANGLKELPHPIAEMQLPRLLEQFHADLPSVQAAEGEKLFVGLLEALAARMTGR